MHHDFTNGQNYNHTESFRAQQRELLEFDVQNLVGPIANIGEMSDAELYGIRDEYRAQQRLVAERMVFTEDGE